ncbi:T9SS type A sorting domain-containing protein [Empedobacter tilapiae]
MKKFYFNLLKVSFAFSLLLFSSNSKAQVYLIGNGEIAKNVSNEGKVVVLNSSTANFFWTPENGLQLLGDMPDNVTHAGNPSVSADGKTIATTTTNPSTNITEMGIYDIDSKKWTYLGNLGVSEDGKSSSVWNMTPDANIVVGSANAENKEVHAIYWEKEKGLIDLGTSFPNRYARINDVSNNGDVFVGWQDDNFGTRTGCFWENGVQTLITNPDGTLVNEISRISGDGKWMIGASGFYATRWSKETGLIKIEHPYASSFFSGAATTINNDGSVILGYYRGPGPAIYGEGFIWTEDTGLVNLNTYVKDVLKYDDLGITFALPLGMSADGKQIVGYGKSSSNNAVSFLISLPKDDLSTNEVNKVNFDIFPNPTTEIITINSNGKISSSILYNTNGEVVLRSNNKQINISSLPKGIYIIKTIIDGKDYTKKVIKK